MLSDGKFSEENTGAPDRVTSGGEDSLLFPAGWSGKAALKGGSSASLLPWPLQKSKGSSLALDSLTSLVQRIKTHSGHLKG